MVAPSVIPGRAFQRVDRVSRLLFHWTARDLSLVPRTGGTPTYARSSPGMAIDRLGRIRMAVHSQPRFWHHDLDGDGVRETPTLRMEGPRTQKLTAPEDLSNAAWNKPGVTVPSTNNPSPRNRDLTACFVREDTSTGGHEINQNFTIGAGANPTGAIVFIKAQGRTKGRFRLMSGGGANEFGGTFDLVAGTLVANQGASATNIFVKLHALGDGWFAFEIFGQTSNTTTVTFTVVFRNASDQESYTGDGASGFLIWGCVATDNTMAESYWGTGASAAADNFTAPMLWSPSRDITVFGKVIRPAHADAAAGQSIGRNCAVVQLSDQLDVSGGSARIMLLGGARNVEAALTSPGTDIFPAIAIPAGASGSVLRVCAQYRNLSKGGFARVSVGGAFGSEEGPITAFAAWNAQLLAIGCQSGGTSEFGGDLLEIKVGPGLYTPDQMEVLT